MYYVVGAKFLAIYFI